MRARVQPGKATCKTLNSQLIATQVLFVNIGDFQFASRRRLQRFGNVDYLIVIEVQSRYRKA